jgi:hypothetical protein
VCQGIHEDRRCTINDVYHLGTFQRILTEDSNMRLTAAKSVPHLLSDKQKKIDFLCARTYRIWTGTFFLSALWILSVTENKHPVKGIKGEALKDNVEIQVKSQAVLVIMNWRPQMLPAGVQMLGLVYKCWREQYQPVARVSSELLYILPQSRNFWLAPYTCMH